MAVPKRKQSHARTNKRRSNNSKLTAPTMVKCSKCGEYNLAHRVCSACGYYADKQIVNKENA
ncbi:MAG: 50S ribosomal protein L32 [Clostridia bacterium]|jgi:large subunit ribosomal protein L32|nr:50S ribosomal protein L32 [Clostridia bacterium]MBO5379860.1 50S ribosomal protein L32 [Clostridia bacterium]MBQ3017762.1 50S ribosomal protein L32 [Clostridia bacterium]MBQ4107997.1 50S ribosomal protein L32 [Clostridia bacterium]MBR2943658.1 50S ribosomal protein L32 [Clostridia bacterium]